ncbi:MAG: DUF4296 domain-containing protein [Flavobacteriales bacterium]|nr:DUF4296 domain-containing protein [Flavobacteriales bacterium]
MRKLLLICLMAVACSASEEAPPPDVLPRDRFKDVLLEAQLIEARMNHELVVAHVSTIPADEYYAEMFEAEGTTKEQFQRSFAYYTEKPELMKAIYEEILAELTRRKDEQPQ